MNYFSAFESTPGIRKIVVADADGSVLDAMGGVTPEAENIAGLAAVVSRQLNTVGRVLRLGVCDLVVVRSQSTARVLLVRGGNLAALEVVPKQLSSDGEAKLRSLDWMTRGGDKSSLGPMAVLLPAPQHSAKIGVSQMRPQIVRTAVNDAGTSRSPLNETARVAPRASGPEPARSPEVARHARPTSPPLPPPLPVAALASDVPSKNKSAGNLPIAATDAMFSGDLQMVCMADLLEFCRIGQRTGTLLCSSKEETGRFRIRRGMIIDAASPKTSASGLLSRLVDSGDATEEQGRGLALKSDEESDNVLVGQRLIAEGFTDAEAVRKAMLIHVQTAVEELLCWTTGRFAFHPTTLEGEPAEPVAEFNPQVVLLRIYKEQDEAARR